MSLHRRTRDASRECGDRRQRRRRRGLDPSDPRHELSLVAAGLGDGRPSRLPPDHASAFASLNETGALNCAVLVADVRKEDLCCRAAPHPKFVFT